MHHPSGHLVYFDAAELRSVTNAAEKRAMLGSVLGGIIGGDMQAGNTAYCLVADTVHLRDTADSQPVPDNSELAHGWFDATNSLEFVRQVKRLRGFLNAIGRWPKQSDGILGVGCGTFPILELAAAYEHPQATVSAVEINPEAASAAAAMVDLFGYNNQISVINADIADHRVDANTTAAVTETFSAAQSEPGPKIVRLLHRAGVHLITPSALDIQLIIPSGKRFPHRVDLRHDTHAAIAFDFQAAELSPRGDVALAIHNTYLDDFGVVMPGSTETEICQTPYTPFQTPLREVLQHVNGSGRLVYELGTGSFAPSILSL